MKRGKRISEGPGERIFRISYKKYIRLYFVFPPILAWVLTDSLRTIEALITMLFIVIAMHMLYVMRLYDYFAVVVGSDALKLYNLVGDEELIAYNDLLGPFIKDYYAVKYYTYVSAKQPQKKLTFNNFIEKPEECLALISSRMGS